MRRISLLFASLVLAPVSHAVVWADDINDATVLDFGARSIFRGVGMVNDGLGIGTGTYIGTGKGSGWVLTAAHVLDFGQSATFNVPSIGNFSITGAWSFEDISIARITSSNANLLAGVATPRLNLNPLVAGTNVVSAGFGNSGPQVRGTNYNPFDGQRRGFQSVVNQVYTDSFGTWVEDRFDRPGDRNKRTIEGFGAPGDSGSAFIDEANYSVLGVLTGGDPEKYGGLNDYSALRPEVSRQIYSLTGINPVPEPASMAALGLGVVAMLRRRKRA